MILESRRQYTQSLTRPPAIIRYTGGINTTKSLRRDFSKMVIETSGFHHSELHPKESLIPEGALKSDDYKLVKNDIANR